MVWNALNPMTMCKQMIIIDKMYGLKNDWNGTLEIVMIIIKHLEINLIPTLNNPWGVDMPLNK